MSTADKHSAGVLSCFGKTWEVKNSTLFLSGGPLEDTRLLSVIQSAVGEIAFQAESDTPRHTNNIDPQDRATQHSGKYCNPNEFKHQATAER